MRVGRPVGHEGASDDLALLDRAPVARVVGELAVVAHHEVVAGRDVDRVEVLLGRGDVRLVQGLAALACGAGADLHVPVGRLHPVAGHADQPLDVGDARDVVAGLRGVAGPVRVEHDDVAAVRVLEVVQEAHREHAIADVQRAFHRRTRDAVGLDDEALDAVGDRDRNDQRDQQVDDRDFGAALRSAGAALAAGSWSRP